MKQARQTRLRTQQTGTMEDTEYRRWIQEVKSPFEVNQLDRTSATWDGGRRENVGRRERGNTNFGGSEIGWGAREEAESGSRGARKKRIFQEKDDRNQSGFWPSLLEAITDLFTRKATSPATPQPQQLYSLDLQQSKFTNLTHLSNHSRIIPSYHPYTSPPSPTSTSLYYQNPELPPHQHQFITFLLKILPKLFLKSTISSQIYASRSEVLEALMGRLIGEEKQRVLESLFGGGVGRIDRRLGAETLQEFVGGVAEMSKSPLVRSGEQRNRVLNDIDKLLQLLSEVQSDIRVYLSSANRLHQLSDIFTLMCDSHRPAPLLNSLQSYLSQCGIMCTTKQLLPLGYIWKGIESQQYTQARFIEELTRNDYVVREQEKGGLDGELRGLGFQRN